MPRQVISISISDELLERMLEHWVDLGYSSISEYIRELIRNDLRQNVQQGTMPVRYFGTRRRMLEQRKSR
jgi:metal-responsive CopG/Arc/MetJ family transcriptional regulator